MLYYEHMTLDDLAKVIAGRRSASADTSYTAKLLGGGVNRIGKKIGEEAAELIIAAKDNDRTLIAHEAADLLYHTLVLLEETHVPLSDIYDILDRRHRAPRPEDGNAAPDRRAQ
jgi:phosphoribosyl-ATP pyrophosphohydrolase/phosphoribosyl-AMP cyclohydrolase